MDIERFQRAVGTQLAGKWQIERLLGAGGAAAVYAAVHRNGKRAAIKILHRELLLEPDVVSRFVQEGYVANAIEHPGVVRILDDGQDESGLPFLVMELLHGQTVAAFVAAAGRGLAPEVALAIVDETLAVLEVAHTKGILHRDIKPENLFVAFAASGAQPHIKVLDFGIAQFRQNPHRTHTTEVGARMGTPAFMSPEQARGLTDQLDARSDLFSVGATLLQMLTGTLLHTATAPNERLLQAMTQSAQKRSA